MAQGFWKGHLEVYGRVGIIINRDRKTMGRPSLGVLVSYCCPNKFSGSK